MPWQLLEEVPATEEGYRLSAPLTGDVLIKIEHIFRPNPFTGFGYVWISDEYPNDEHFLNFRSYPYVESARIYSLELPALMGRYGFGTRHLWVRRSSRAVVNSDTHWRVKISIWIDQ